MSASRGRSQEERLASTEYGIPVRNLWHMLLYAWEELPLSALPAWVLLAAENAPSLDGLLASVLMRLMYGRLRIGLGSSYVDEEQSLRGIRGRIDFTESLKRRTFERGEVVSQFQAYSSNEPRNQIIRTTLARLAQAGQFGRESASAKELRHSLRQLLRDLQGIDLIEVTPELIHRARSRRDDRDYRLMLAICDLVLQRQMPDESAEPHGKPLGFAALDRDAFVLHRIYERFVANFYRIHLRDWSVTSQKRLDWYENAPTSQYLPSMIPDLVLQAKSSGRLVIVDTKFTSRSLIENQWGKPVFDSAHLYQLYAYLRSQEHVSPEHSKASGILLYPVAKYDLSERMELQGHIIRVESLDLSAPWQEIESRLLDLITRNL